ncbi:hypothetical protein B484DRAFT_460338, partial [Ochromonadaceae sp. CCMP2298]
MRCECLFALGRPLEAIGEGLRLLSTELGRGDPTASALVIHALLMLGPHETTQDATMENRLERCDGLLSSLLTAHPDTTTLIGRLADKIAAARHARALANGGGRHLPSDSHKDQGNRSAAAGAVCAARSPALSPEHGPVIHDFGTRGEHPAPGRARGLVRGRNDSALAARGAAEEGGGRARTRTRHAAGLVTLGQAAALHMRTVINPCKFCYLLSAMQMLAASRVLQAY